MLIPRDHPTGSKWTCGECATSMTSCLSCSDCHTVLCDACAPKTHRVPAGAEVGKVCLLVTETIALVA